MKKLIILSILSICAGSTWSQEKCEDMHKVASKFLSPTKEAAGNFISDGQVYTAFFSGDAGETAEFTTTMYGGSTYRVATTAGSKDNYVIMELQDREGNVLFTNKDYANEPYWDFQVQSTLDVKIVLKLDMNKKDQGCVTMLIGYQQ